MNAPAIMSLVAVYLFGIYGSFVYNGFDLEGYQLLGRMIFWPLFIIAGFLKATWTALLDLTGQL